MIDICDHHTMKNKDPKTNQWYTDDFLKLSPSKLTEVLNSFDERLNLLEEKCLTEEDYQVDNKTMAIETAIAICDRYLQDTDHDIYFRDGADLDDIHKARKYMSAIIKELKDGLR